MKDTPLMKRLLACGLMLMTWACAAASAENASPADLCASVLANGQQCLPAPDALTITWVDTPNALDRFLGRCHAHRLGATPPPLPAVDFDRFRVLALEMGQKPSAGYGFDSKKVTAILKGQSAIVRVTCQRPLPGAMTAQVLTNPWVLIRLPVGAYDRIRVVDQDNQQLAQIAVTSP